MVVIMITSLRNAMNDHLLYVRVQLSTICVLSWTVHAPLIVPQLPILAAIEYGVVLAGEAERLKPETPFRLG